MKIQHLNGIGQRPQWINEIWGVDDLYQQPDGIYSSGLRGMLGLGDLKLEKIKIGGKLYDPAQLQDATITASIPTKVYKIVQNKYQVYKTIPAGSAIGRVWSFIKSSGIDGRAYLMFENSATAKLVDGVQFYYAANEDVTDTGLKDQGVKTVDEQVKQAEEEKLKEDSPVEYYIKKYGGKALLIVGGIVIVGGIARELLRSSLNKKKPEPIQDTPAEEPKALEGIKKSTIKTIKV